MIWPAILVLLGSTLEQYCYMLYPFMVPFFSSFFLTTDTKLSLVFFICALIRPLGALAIGYIGDNYSRNRALFISMSLMSLSCLGIYFLPSYSAIGIYSIILLTFFRMLQTISVAGEHSGAAIFLIEKLQGSQNRKGAASGLAYFFTMTGTLGARFAKHQSGYSNWKNAFLVGALLGIIAFFLKFLKQDAINQNEVQENFDLKKNFIAAVLISAAMSGMFYYNLVFFERYLTHYNVYSNSFGLFYMVFYVVSLLIMGFISDYIKRKEYIIIIPSVVILLLALPSLYLCSPIMHFINIFALAAYVGPSHAILFDLFPRKRRYTLASLGYSIGTSLIGGFTLFASDYLFGIHPLLPSVWLIFLTMLGISGGYLIKS